MSSNHKRKNTAEDYSFFWASLSVGIVVFGIRGNLNLYVHPRYIFFSTVMAGLGVLLYLIHAYNHSVKDNQKFKKVWFFILGITFLALYLPARPLSSRAAQNRSQTSVFSNPTSGSSFDRFSQNYSHFTLQDWSSLLATSPTDEQVVGKKAIVEGFIFDTDDQRKLARFKLSCCAVDATPLAVTLKKTDEIMGLKTGSWQRLEGTFVADGDEYVLEVTKATQIDQPKEPYGY